MKPILELETLEQVLAQAPCLDGLILQGIDCRDIDFGAYSVEQSVFLGCHFASRAVMLDVQERGALVFPRLPALPYDPYRSRLYSWQELLEGGEKGTDYKIYKHMLDHRQKQRSQILEALMQRIHDHAIDNALEELLQGRKTVGIMGGHGTHRTAAAFRDVVEVAWGLTRAGYFVASGGGPGIMEAANLGAWLAAYEQDAIEQALAELATAPHYQSEGYTDAALRVLDRFPDGAESLAVPTWFYGHEPSNVFSPHIAKYFANSLREDGLLAIAIHGVVYAPGSAGTLQEVFLDLCQNHYSTFEYQSPMVFMGQEMWQEKIPVVPLLKSFSAERSYHDMIFCHDDPADIVEFIVAHPPRK